MKLHLPKMLLTAVVAAGMLGGNAFAMTRTMSYENVTFNTSGTYDGVAVDYADGVLTFTDGRKTLNATFTLDYDKFAALTAKEDLLCINVQRSNDTATFGLRATAGDTITGNNNGGDYSGTSMTAETLRTHVTWTDSENQTGGTISNLRAVIDADNATNSGTNLYIGSGTDTIVYQATGLRYTPGTITTADVNTNLITSMTLQDVSSYTYTNAANTWQKTFDADKVTDATSTKLQMNGGDGNSAATNANPIVVGGDGHLHLEAWNQGAVNVNDDIYAGSSTYSAAANYGVIRISNDGAYGANLSGNIYLVEDTSIKGTGSQAIVLSGTITDKQVPGNDGATVDGNYTLTVGGAGFDISGKVDLGGLNIVQGYSSGAENFAGTVELSSTDATLGQLSIGTNATLTVTGALAVSSSIANEGNMVLEGSLAFDGDGLYTLYKEAEGATYSHGEDGYMTTTGSQYYAIQGTGSYTQSSEASVSFDGVTTTLTQVTDGYVFTAGEFTDLSTFYIKSSKVTANAEGYTDIYAASTYIIDAGKELDVNGQYFAGKAFVLGEGATLSNTGAVLNGNYRMFQSIELTGDAYVDGTSNMGLLAFNSADAAAATSTLKLNGHTLTQKSDASFFLTGTTVEGAGTIKIQAGTLQVGIEVNHANNADTSAEGVDFVLAGGTLTIREGGNILTAKSLSGDGTVTGSGTLKLNNTGTAEERTITGNVLLGSLELTGNDNYTITGNLNVTGYTLLNAEDVTLGAGTHSIGRLDLSKGQVSDSTLILENGAQVTVTTDLWVGSNAGITIKEGAALTKGNVKMEALSSTTDATIAFLASSGDQFSAGNANYAYNNAKVSVTTSDAEGGDVTFTSKLVNSEIVNSGAGNLTVNNSANTLTAVTADAGNVKIVNSSTEQVSIGSITAAAGKTVSAEVADLNVGTLTLGDSASAFTTTGSLTIGELVLDLSTYDVNQSYTLVSTTGEGATVGLSTAYSQKYNGYTATVGGSGTGSLTLSFEEIVTSKEIKTTVSSFGGITDGMLTLNVGADLTDATKVLISGISDSIMAEILGNANLPEGGMVGITLVGTDKDPFVASAELVVGFQGKDGVYYGEAGTGNVGWVYQAAYIPEPTTATLSLLALAGLAMRRRRKA